MIQPDSVSVLGVSTRRDRGAGAARAAKGYLAPLAAATPRRDAARATRRLGRADPRLKPLAR